MKDEDKTKERLVDELVELRQRIAELETSETERKRAEGALRQRNRELALLNRAGQVLNSTLDLDQVLVTVLEEVRRLLGVVACSVWLTDPETDELVCQQATGLQSEVVRGWRLAPGQGLAGWVARSGESLVVPDAQANERHFKDVDQQTGLALRSIVTVPLRVKQDMIGVLQVVDTEIDRFISTDLTLLEPLAASAASAIENARLFEREQEQRELSEALEEAAAAVSSTLDLDQVLDHILEQVERVVAGDAFSVMLLIEDDAARLARWRGYQLPEEVAQPSRFEIPIAKYPNLIKIARMGKAVVVPDTSVDPDWVPAARDRERRRSYVGAPIQVGSVTVGFLNVSSAQPGQFGPAHAQRLETFASHAAAAIENARLYERARKEIAERQRAEEALRASQEYARNIIDSSLDMIIAVDMDRHIVEFNKAAQETFGYRPEEVLGVHVDILYADPQEGLRVHQETIEKGQYVREILDRRKNGQVFPAFLSASVLRDARGELVGVMGVARDITERQRAEEALRESEERFKGIFENTTIGLYRTTPDGRILMANPVLLRMMGYSSHEELAQRNLEEEGYEPAYPRSAFKQRIEGEGQVIGLESAWVKRDGTTLFIRESARAIRDEAGNTLYYEGAVEDITERKRAEEALRASLREKEVLLKEVHHRVKNNLQVISSLLSLQSEHIEDEQALEMFMESRHRVKSMALIHERLYQAEDLARINFAEYIHSLAAYLFRAYRVSPGAITLKVSVGDVALELDMAITCGLILNELVSNALKHAFPPKVDKPAGKEDEIRIGLCSDDDKVTLMVSDNGIGFPEDLDFRNTESLGLQLVIMLVEQSGGAIELDRSDGTTFKITFAEQRP